MKNRRRNNKKNKKVSGRQEMVKNSFVSSTSLSRPVRLVLRADPLLLTVATATSIFVTPTYFTFDTVSDLSTENGTLVNLFQAWRMIKIVAKITPMSTYTGSAAFGFAEDIGSISSISAFAASSRAMVRVHSNVRGTTRLVWNAASYEDLNFHEVATAISPAPVSFIAYTNLADFGTTLNGTGGTLLYYRVDFDVTCDLRGLGV
jgi:hypothetical protein